MILINRVDCRQPILSWMKLLIVDINYYLRVNTVQNIKDCLLYMSASKDSFHIKEEEMSDINMILTFISSKTSKTPGYSQLINTFANN